MPGQRAVDGPTAGEIIARVFPQSNWLTPEDSSVLLARLGPVGLIGGAVHDALVGEAARTNGRMLLTRGRRAIPTYTILGVTHRIVGA